MRATSVFVRFLSLLDVALVLLGVLMIALTLAQLRSDAGDGGSGKKGLAELANVRFVYLYAGWKGPQKGRCYLLKEDQTIGEEVSTDTAIDIKGLEPTAVLLLFDENGWYSDWPASRLASIEQTWNVKVIPVYNVPLPSGGKP